MAHDHDSVGCVSGDIIVPNIVAVSVDVETVGVSRHRAVPFHSDVVIADGDIVSPDTDTKRRAREGQMVNFVIVRCDVKGTLGSAGLVGLWKGASVDRNLLRLHSRKLEGPLTIGRDRELRFQSDGL